MLRGIYLWNPIFRNRSVDSEKIFYPAYANLRESLRYVPESSAYSQEDYIHGRMKVSDNKCVLCSMKYW